MNDIFKWKENLPIGWQALPLKAVATYSVSSVDKLTQDDEVPIELCNYVDVYKNDYITKDLDFMIASATEDEIKKYSLEIGDVLITKDSESWDDIGIPALVLFAKINLLCGYHLAVLKSKIMFPEFLFRCIQSKEIRIQLELASKGVTRFGLPKDEIGRLILPVPEFELQKEIAAYLNKEIIRIDALIKAKENLLLILSEKKQSLITNAVTKGLNQKVKMKDSGIEWMGKIPDNWVVKKMKYISDLKSGEFITSELIKENDIYPVYGGNGLRGYTTEKTHSGKFVLIGRQGALCGNINYGEGDFYASEHAIVCNPIKEYNTFWFGELLRIMNLNQYSIAAAQPGLSVEVIKNLLIPAPSLKEQIEISVYIKKNISIMDSIITRTLKSVELLKERRSTLITLTVTGQVNIQTKK